MFVRALGEQSVIHLHIERIYAHETWQGGRGGCIVTQKLLHKGEMHICDGEVK